ncbi:MAG TPA: hypothetical protein DIT99_30840, partial [Candidatus Latescibacteria bacterium]|nr:hypothetical protein [Candidatus Latescibacterota bacterium]
MIFDSGFQKRASLSTYDPWYAM